MGKAREAIDKMMNCAMEMSHMGQPNDGVVKSLDVYRDQLRGLQMALTSTVPRRRSLRGSSGGWGDEAPRSFQDATGWIAQQKVSGKAELLGKGGTRKCCACPSNVMKMSVSRMEQLRDLQKILQEISLEIMWVNEREEEELMFDWGDKNIEQYIPKKQEAYSKLMSALEEKEKDLYKAKTKADVLLKNNHPASDKIEAYMDTLQTQWSWLLQITKCIDVHLKENGAYWLFFKEANDTNSALQKEHESIRKKFSCDKDTSLEDLMELLKGLEKEKEQIMEHRRQVQHLVSKSKSIVRLRPRNPEVKSNGTVVKALCDFKQDQKVILTGNEAILKDNSQRSKWLVTGPGGLDMLVPSVCLIIPPPNPLSISIASKNEQYFESILSIWNQLYINVKSLIAWQYCVLDIKYINSLTITMLSKMRPDEYKQIIKNMEAHFEEFKITSRDSQMFADEDKRSIENQVNGAQAHYEKLVVELPVYGHQHIHICVGDDGVQDCSYRITELKVKQNKKTHKKGKLRIVKDLEDMNDSDKAQFLRSELGGINQRLGSLESSSSSVARAEDLVKVHEARLTEKETTSLTPSEVEEYISILKHIKAELDQKRDILTSMEAELTKATHWNSQVGSSSHKCDMMLMKYTEHAGVLSDRWRRIEAQISTRLQDLQLYLPQLHHYKQTSASLIEWIDVTRKKQDAMQATKIDNVQALNTEIKAKKETVESVLKDNETCVHAIKDYEGDLASYASGLETLLKIPFKRTMLKSPSTDLNQEFSHIQTRYMELLALSGNYHKFLGELLKSMEELKIRNTRIDMLEEELRQLREGINDSNSKNKSLEEAIGQYELKLSQSQSKLLSLEEVERTTALKCSSTKDSLDSTQSQLADLKDEIERLKYLLGEEKRKSKLAEERYHQQKEEYDSVLKKRQNELETVSWSKMEVEKSVTNKEHEIEQLRRQLAENEAMVKELQKEMSKVRSKFITEISSLKVSYESQIQISRTDIQRLAAQRDEDTAELQLQCDRTEADRRSLEKEIMRLRVTIGQVEEQRKTAEEEARSRQAMFIEEGCRRREMESQVELLMRQRDEESSQYREELAELMRNLQEKSDQLAYVTHSLEEEARRRKITEEGQAVLEQSLAQLQTKLTTSSTATTQLTECKEELQHIRLEFERESEERCRVVQNMNRLQGRIKDLQVVRDELEVQVESLRTAHQEEVNRRKQVEADLEKMTVAMTECTNTTTALRQNQEQASTSQSRSQQECHRLQEELDISMRLKQTTASQINQLNNELKALKQQLLQEEVRVKEANLRNEDLCKSIEEKSEALVENSSELQRLKDLIETQTKERLVLEEELRETQFEKEELMKSKRGREDDLSTQIAALELRLQATERSNLDSCDLVSGLSLERDKFKLEAEKLQKQVTEIRPKMQSLQSEYDAIVKDRDALLLKLQRAEKDKEHIQRIEEDLSRMKLSLDSEHHSRQRLQGENERIKMDLSYWKDQCDGKQGLIRQLDSDKEILEREKKSMKSELELLRREIRELEDNYKSRFVTLQKDLQEATVVKQTLQTELKTSREPPALDASSVIFDGVRKPVTASHLLDCRVLDNLTFNQVVKGYKTVFEVSSDKKVNLKGTGPIAGVIIESSKSPGSSPGPLYKLTFTEAKKENLLPPDSIDLLLDAQAATGHIIDPRTNQKLTVEEACNQGVVDEEDRERLLAAEAAAIGYSGPGTKKPLSVFQAMKKGLIEKSTTLRLLQAQESVGGILDPVLSVFLPRDVAIERKLVDDTICHALNQKPELYLDPESEEGVTYMAMKRRCKVEPHTGLLLLPIPEKDPSKLIFDGVRKPVSAQQLLDCGVLDKPTFNQLLKGEITVPEVSEDKKVFLKGTGSIAGVTVGPSGKMSFNEAKKQKLVDPDKADLLLEAQAATGHIIDPVTNRKLTVDEACAKRVVDRCDRDKLLAAEAAAVGYKDPRSAQPLSVFEAVKKGLVDKKTGLRLLQAQESAGGILDPNLSVFLPKDTAMKRNLLDEDLCRALNQNPECYVDPETEQDSTYEAMKKKCKTEPHTGLKLLPISGRKDPSKLIFDGVRKPVSAQQLLDCGVLDKPTFNQLLKGEKTVPEVSEDKKVFLKGTGPIAGVTVGPSGKMSFNEAKKQKLFEPDKADLLLEAQAATGHIIDPVTNRKLTVDEACAKGVVDRSDRDKLLAAEAAAVGYKDPRSVQPLSVFEAMKKGLVDKKTGLRLLQAQESAGGILDPNLSVFLPKDAAMKRNLLDEDLCRALNQNPECYVDPETEQDSTYEAMKKKCKTEPHTESVGGILDPTLSVFLPKDIALKRGLIDEDLYRVLNQSPDCYLDPDTQRPTTYVSIKKKCKSDPSTGLLLLPEPKKGSTCIAGVYDEARDKVLSIYEAMKNGLLRSGTSLELLEAQAASGFMIDPVFNLYLTVDEAYKRRLVGPEFKDKLLSAEKAVTGYKLPGTDKIISLFQAIEKGVVEKGHGIRLLEAQIASGGLIDPEHSHRINVNVAYKRGYFDEEMNKILTDESDDTKGFFDPNTEENLTYLELKRRCIVDKNTGLILLPIVDKKKKESTTTNTRRRRRVIIVDPETNKEMTVLEAFNKGYIDHETFIELSNQECEWEEITITDLNGSKRFVITERTSGRTYDITEMLEKKVIDESVVNQYHSRAITLTQFADIITEKAKHQSLPSSPASHMSSATSTSRTSSSFSTSSSTSASKTSTSAFATSTSFRTSSPTPASPTSTSFSTSSPTSISRTSAYVNTYSSTPTSETAMSFSASSPTSVSGTSTSFSTSSSSSVSATSSSTSTVSKETEASLSGSSTSYSSFSTVGSRSLSPTFTKTVTTRTSTVVERSSNVQQSSDSLKRISSVSITLSTPLETDRYLEPVGAIFDTDTVEKISIMEALNRGLVDSITAQKLLEAQACTGGIVDPTNGKRFSIQEACRMGMIDSMMELRLKPAQKAFFGFEDVKTKRRMSIAEAVKERWLPYESGQRFLEFQVVTGGLYDPEMGCRRSIEDALKMGWLDERAAQKLHDIKNLPKCLTCPKSKLKISYKDALDNCLVEDGTGVQMLPASSMSSKGISSPYNAASAPGSTTGSRSCSQRSSRRGSLDYGSLGGRQHCFFSSK
uniref:Desmoplakin b n=1 Tax=Oryzias melastigma TaxID=30732 RepID=A0A3B3C4J7_ORYME